MEGSDEAAGTQPRWLRCFEAAEPAEDIVRAWLLELGPQGLADAKLDPHAARSALRAAIVDAREQSEAVRKDAASGWKLTATIIRAMDDAMGIGPLKPSALFGPKGVDLHAPRQIVKAEGRTGTVGLFWSSVQGAARVDLLLANGITHRLNVAAECERSLPEAAELVTKTVPMKDLQHEQLGEEAEAATVWVEQLRECMELLRGWKASAAASGTTINVNVNCQMGKNRSGAVIAAWLCLEHGWELIPAVEHLRQVSTLALGNPHLNVALAHVVGKDDVDIPLNPADEGGSWVTFSPPGSPKQMRTPKEEDLPTDSLADGAARRLHELNLGEREELAAEEEDGLADLADLLDEL
ncbi:hypothetical protein AB1Y20_020553 [Prymnesium parvum]|uniref:Tyrosine specific protein phosphatases domain-containing protein n=1 Tax=Prymnesium parvum TaxID=97485 RepID=A0AB34JXY0_PRYPA